MRAVAFVGSRVEVVEEAEPPFGPQELLVRVRGAGLNNADLLQHRGEYGPPPGAPATPGLEVAGEVVAVGALTYRFGIGDRVMAVVPGGGQAELVAVAESVAVPVPDAWDWATAGGFPEAFSTAHDALFSQCGLRPGERVCVHGAAGGVGTAAVQLAAIAGSEVVATVRAEAVRGRIATLGAGTVVDPAEAEGHGPYDVVLELIGGSNMESDVRSLASGGRISVLGTDGGSHGNVDLDALCAKSGRVLGSTLRSRPLAARAAVARRVEREVLPLAPKLQVPLHAVFALPRVAEAYERFAAGQKVGKIVVMP